MRTRAIALLAPLALAVAALAQVQAPNRTEPCPTISKVETPRFTLTATRIAKPTDCQTVARYAGKTVLQIVPCEGSSYSVEVEAVFETNTRANSCGTGFIEGAMILRDPATGQTIRGPLDGLVSGGTFTALCNATVTTPSTTKKPAPPMRLKVSITGAPSTDATRPAALVGVLKGVLIQRTAATR